MGKQMSGNHVIETFEYFFQKWVDAPIGNSKEDAWTVVEHLLWTHDLIPQFLSGIKRVAQLEADVTDLKKTKDQITVENAALRAASPNAGKITAEMLERAALAALEKWRSQSVSMGFAVEPWPWGNQITRQKWIACQRAAFEAVGLEIEGE